MAGPQRAIDKGVPPREYKQVLMKEPSHCEGTGASQCVSVIATDWWLLRVSHSSEWEFLLQWDFTIVCEQITLKLIFSRTGREIQSRDFTICVNITQRSWDWTEAIWEKRKRKNTENEERAHQWQISESASKNPIMKVMVSPWTSKEIFLFAPSVDIGCRRVATEAFMNWSGPEKQKRQDYTENNTGGPYLQEALCLFGSRKEESLGMCYLEGYPASPCSPLPGPMETFSR